MAKVVAILAAMGLVLAVVAVKSISSGSAGGILPYRDSKVVARGAGLYAEYCGSCHGAELEGQKNWRRPDGDGYLPAPPHDANGHTWHHPDRQLIEITRLGTEKLAGGNYKSRMTGFGDSLDEAQIIAILAYIKSTWPKRIQDRHDQINEDAGL